MHTIVLGMCTLTQENALCHTLRMAYIIAGLGNPGAEYAQTRHNTGRIILEDIVTSEREEFSYNSKLDAEVSKIELSGEKVTFIAPNTFMNKSGKAIAPLIKSIKSAEKLVVIYDDFHLPFGKLRMSFDRSSGGHNGVESVISALKTQAFVRIRVGIGPTKTNGEVKVVHGAPAVEKIILGKFKKEELEEIHKLSKKIRTVLETFISEGREQATLVCNS